jgi:hypothetical protein
MESQEFQVKDNSSLHKYRTEIPNIIEDLNLDPYAYRLYCYYKKVAGDSGSCYQRKRIIEEKTKMSKDVIKKRNKILARPFSELGGKSLIKITQRKGPDDNNLPTLIEIVDIWPDNFQILSTRFSNDLPSVPRNPTLGAQKSDLGAQKATEEEPIQEKPIKNKNIAQTRKFRPEQDFYFSDSSHKFENISNDDMIEWKKAYPSIKIPQEIARAQQWILANPTKSRKKLWRKFLTNWFLRANDSAENKSAYRSQSFAKIDRRTRNIDGSPVDSPADGLF